MNQQAVAQELVKVAKELMALQLVPRTAPDVAELKHWHKELLDLLRQSKITKPGEYYYARGWDGPLDLTKAEAEKITEHFNQQQKVIDAHRGKFGFVQRTGFDHSFDDMRNWADGILVRDGVNVSLFDPDWPEKVVLAYGGQSHQVPENIMSDMDLFLSKTQGRDYIPRTPKEAAFLKFKAAELLENCKRAGATISTEKVTRSRNNPNFYATVKFTAEFGEALVFSLNIGWIHKRGATYVTMNAERYISSKYEQV
jgi:hypothetical protein